MIGKVEIWKKILEDPREDPSVQKTVPGVDAFSPCFLTKISPPPQRYIHGERGACAAHSSTKGPRVDQEKRAYIRTSPAPELSPDLRGALVSVVPIPRPGAFFVHDFHI